MPPAFYLQVYGCQMNVGEAGVVRSLLADAGWTETGDEGRADLLLMLTCSVRSHAEQRALGRLGSFRAARAARPGTLIGVLGCMAQHLGDVLVTEHGADVVLGPDEYRRLPGLLPAVRAGAPAVHTGLSGECYDSVLPRSDNPVSAFVTVMRGCDNRCSYCIVPSVKGSERSRSPAAVVAEAEQLARQGIREVTLLGQNVLAYRHGGTRFPDLLRQVARVPGLRRVRFLTSHPRDLDESVLEAMIEPGVCPALHLPVQSGSDRVLGLMNRGYTAADYLGRVELVRSRLPDAGLTTDVMVAFPTETEEDFEATLALVESVRFDYAYMFRFSPRPGTPAAGLKPGVSYADAGRRLSRLIEVQNRVTRERNRELVGRELELLVEGPGPRGNGVLARTAANRAVVVETAAPPGAMLRCRVTRLSGWTPVAEVIRPRAGAARLAAAGCELSN